MIDPRALIAARSVGEIRYAVAYESTSDLSRVLSEFGLLPDKSLLVEHDRDSSHAILTTLLWKDMAYEDECMPRHQAESLAQQILDEHALPGAKYFSNCNVAKEKNWNPLTESTFDAGLVIINEVSHIHFCIWFQDED
ncbi:MAG: hypothetical protein BWK76_08370 [Desulfobulbaceae bacterium A2]|nr:MAG: hypothetical protein BWK76_08370 [Desulfobulbaceae bacterium A2]